MRNIFFQSIKLILMFSFIFSQTRYKDEIFSEVIKTEDVVYGNAPDIPFDGAFEWYTADIDLTMDIYEGDGDTLTNRPVIIFMHSGAFFTGSHEADDMVALSNSSAKMGYVAVSIAYRLNYNLFSTYSAERGIYRGLQDLSAAVRYLREHHSDYGIDYDNIFIWGSSAGAFSGIHLSYMEEEDRMASTFVNNFGWDPDLGCIDCSGNDFDHDRKPKAVVACWGGIFDLDWINEGDEIPVIMFHGVADSTVPFNEGYLFQNQFSLPWVYGSNLVYNKLDSLNIQSELHAPEGMNHEYWGTYAGDWTGDGPNEHFDIIKEEAYSFLFDIPLTNYKSWAKGLKKAGYATDPKYSKLLINIIKRYNLDQYDNSNESFRRFYFSSSYGLPYLYGVGINYINKKNYLSLDLNSSYVYLNKLSFCYNYKLYDKIYIGLNTGLLYFNTKQKIDFGIKLSHLYDLSEKKRNKKRLISCGLNIASDDTFDSNSFIYIPTVSISYLF